ncbi:MAG: C25 family cysteine peptidase [Alistipes indistinctus]
MASASASVSEPFRRNRLFRGDMRLDERIYTQNLFVSPCVERSIVDKVFDRGADFYYFNLHGSDAPTACSFYASYQQQCYEAVTPRQLASAEKPNVVVTEACYGGKFQDYGRGETMLLAAMGDMTLLYRGSSRIAWGASKSSSAADLDNADRLTNVYMAKLLEGYTAGEAFYMARQSFFDYNDGYFTPHQALTIVEFNLFGDPFLHVGVRREGAKAHPRAVKALAKGAVNAVVERKCVYEAAPASLIDRVRSAVDCKPVADPRRCRPAIVRTAGGRTAQPVDRHPHEIRQRRRVLCLQLPADRRYHKELPYGDRRPERKREINHINQIERLL